MRYLLFTLLAAFLLFSCEENSLDPLPERERAGLHVLNVYSGVSSIDIRMESFEETRRVAERVAFGESWPATGYATLVTSPEPADSNTTGGTVLKILDNSDKSTLVADRSVGLIGGSNASYCLVDSFGNPLLVKTVDIMEEVKGDSANLRFMNLNSFILSCSLVSADGSVLISSMNFLNFSKFEKVASSRQTFYFVDDFTGFRLDSIPNFKIDPRKGYSFYIAQKQGESIGGVEILD